MRGALVAMVVVGMAAGQGHADPLIVTSGKVVLPVSGLAVDLPKDPRKWAAWSLAGSWSLTSGGASFDGRDVIDQKVGDTLVAGNWIQVGYFDAGACEAVVQELDVPDRWTAAGTLGGVKVAAAGGTFAFDGPLGKVPAVALCAGPADGARLLVYHFYVDRKAPRPGAPTLAALRKDRLLERVIKAWRTGASGPVATTHRPEIRQRGDLPAARPVTLPTSGLTVQLPDDGFVWLAHTAEGEADRLDRMAPATPDLTVEVARLADRTCAQVPDAIDVAHKADPAPLGVPPGWIALPTLDLGTTLERIVCHQAGDDALVVGLLGTPPTALAARDFTPLALLLAALADAAE